MLVNIGNVTPLILEAGNYGIVDTSVSFSGTVEVIGEGVLASLNPSRRYTYGPYTQKREILVRVTYGFAELSSVQYKSSALPIGWFDTTKADTIDHNGDTDSSAALQVLLDESRGDFPTGKDYGKGGMVFPAPGVIKARNLRMSTWSGITNQGPQPSSVITMQHTAEGAPLIQIRDDEGQSQSIGSQPLFFNVALNGDRNNAEPGVLEDGIKMVDLEAEKDDAPIFFNTIVANFSNDGIQIRPTHKQIRAFNLKSIAHGGWSFTADKSSDSKMSMLGLGRSLQGQMKLTNCASFQVSQYDIWTPGVDAETGIGTFLGKYALEWYGPRNVRYFQGEIQGAAYLEGDNSVPNAKRRHQELGCYFVGFNWKVSPETKAGAQGSSYTSMVQLRGTSGIHFALGTFGHSLGPADAEDIAARPKNIWRFGVKGTGSYAGDVSTELGHVTATSVEMLHMHGAAATGVDAPGMTPEVPFTEHWSNYPENVIWRTQKPGTLIEAPTAAPQKNWIALTGSTQTLDVAKYPLLYLALDNSRKLTTAGSTFTIPATAGTLPTGFTKYIVAW